MRQLEERLDNVVYRLGFSGTRAQARQFVTHGHVQVNGQRVDRPSYEVRPGDIISIKRRRIAIKDADRLGKEIRF